jgi:NitT/TauT family transport system substrate-binding protein
MFRESTALALLAVVGLLLGACTPAPAASPTAAPKAEAKPTDAPKPAAAASPVASPSPSPSPAAKPAGAAPAGKTESVKVAHAPSVLFAPLYVAIEKGYFRDQGIDAQLETVAAGQDAMAMAANNQLDVVVAGFGAATFNAIERGLELRIVSSMGRQPQQGYPSALMVRKDLLASGQVKELEDLKGRKVALAGGIGATGSYWMAAKLRTVGLTLKDIEVVNLGFPDQVLGFKQGSIDAGLPPAPFTNQIIRDDSADYFGGALSPGASAVGTVYGSGFIKDRAEVGRRFMTALVRAARDLQGDRVKSDEHLQIFSKYTNIPVDTLRTMDPYDFDPNLRPDVSTLTDMQRVFIEEGVLRFASPIPPERWADESFVNYAGSQVR